MLANLVRTFGVLRLLLLATVVFLIAIAPFVDATVDFSSVLTVLATLVAPALYVVIIFVMPLDMTMTRVFMTDKSGSARQRLQRVFWTEFGFFMLLLITWYPFFSRLLANR